MRYFSIDILRTIAIFVMVFVHFGENLAGFKSPFAGFGAPLFAFLSGASYYLWVKGREEKGVSDEEISKISVRRGLFVFGVGFAFNILVWLPEDTFNWDVLTFIGSALLLLGAVRRLPRLVLLVAAVMAVVISPALREVADYNAYWLNGQYYEPDATLYDTLIGYVIAGYFPVFPWIAYSLTGFVVGSVLFEAEAKRDAAAPTTTSPTSSSVVRFSIAGGALLAVSLGSLAVRSWLPDVLATKFLGKWSMFPPTVIYVSATLGLTLLLVAVTHYLVDLRYRDRVPEGLANIAKTFSRYSLTIYLLHHVAHLWPLWIYTAWQGLEPTTYWMSAMTLWPAYGLGLLFLVVCYVALRLLGSRRTYGAEALMRWICD